MPEKHRRRVGAEHCRRGPPEHGAAPVNHFRRRPGRHEEGSDAVNPRQDHPGARHPGTVAVAIDDRVNYLDVALDGDHDQAGDGAVRDDGHEGVGLEQEAYDPAAGRRRRLERVGDDGEYEKETGEEVEERLVDDEDVDLLATTLTGAQQRQQDEPVRKRSDRSDPILKRAHLSIRPTDPIAYTLLSKISMFALRDPKTMRSLPVSVLPFPAAVDVSGFHAD